jgi:hypothetical protein
LEKDGMSIILDKTQDDDVKMRHFIRMVIFNTQRIRKSSGVRPWNKIHFYYNTDSPNLLDWLDKNVDYLESSLGYPVIFRNLQQAAWIDTVFSYDDQNIKLVIYKLD